MCGVVFIPNDTPAPAVLKLDGAYHKQPDQGVLTLEPVPQP